MFIFTSYLHDKGNQMQVQARVHCAASRRTPQHPYEVLMPHSLEHRLGFFAEACTQIYQHLVDYRVLVALRSGLEDSLSNL